MTIVNTVFVVTATDQTFGPIPGEWHAAQLVSSYGNSVPGLSNYASTESVATGVDGDTLTVTFSPRTGNKG